MVIHRWINYGHARNTWCFFKVLFTISTIHLSLFQQSPLVFGVRCVCLSSSTLPSFNKQDLAMFRIPIFEWIFYTLKHLGKNFMFPKYPSLSKKILKGYYTKILMFTPLSKKRRFQIHILTNQQCAYNFFAYNINTNCQVQLQFPPTTLRFNLLYVSGAIKTIMIRISIENTYITPQRFLYFLG